VDRILVQGDAFSRRSGANSAKRVVTKLYDSFVKLAAQIASRSAHDLYSVEIDPRSRPWRALQRHY
jgi:hypothetical protein